MTALALALAAALAACAVLYVARGFLLRPDGADDDVLESVDQARLAALDERDRALAALQELEFDHRTGKVSDEDYAALLGPLRQAAARALVVLDAQDADGAAPAPAPPEAEPAPDAAAAAEVSGDAIAGPAAREP